jgi:hypothetical protein
MQRRAGAIGVTPVGSVLSLKRWGTDNQQTYEGKAVLDNIS